VFNVGLGELLLILAIATVAIVAVGLVARWMDRR
jgi:hypothetical protein